MKKAYLILLLFVVTIGCGLSNSEKEKSEIKPYFLLNQKQLPISVLRGVDLAGSETLQIYGDEKWLQSLDHGKTFKIYSNPEGVYFTKIMNHKGIYYGLGAHSVDHPIFGDKDSTFFLFGYTNSIFTSEDAINWKQIIAMRDMREFIFQNDSLLHMGIDEGISTLNLNTGKSSEKKFFSSKLTDLINDFYITESGTIFAGSHDGIYKSVDMGKNWERTSRPEISKDDDYIEAFFEVGNDIYAVGTKIYVSKDDGEKWDLVDFGFIDDSDNFKNLSGEDAFITEDGYMYSASYFGVIVSKTVNPRNSEFIFKHGEDSYTGTASRYDQIIAFKNGDIIVIEETLNKILRGVKNEESPFWE